MIFFPLDYPDAGPSNTISIDFGTNNTTIHYLCDGSVRTLETENGEGLLKSVVQYQIDGRVIVGRNPASVPSSTLKVHSVKRLLGIPYDELGENELGNYGASLERDEDGGILLVNDSPRGRQVKTPFVVVTDIFREVKQLAEKRLEGEVKFVVITCPTTFTSKQKCILRRAVSEAGFMVLSLLTEPTAAGIHYIRKNVIQNNSVFLVYDFGAGTLDLSVVYYHNNSCEVIASGGSRSLGGDDIDQALYSYCEGVYESMYGELLPYAIYPKGKPRRTRMQRRYLNIVETAKIALQEEGMDSYQLNFATDDEDADGAERTITLSLSQMNARIERVIQESEECIEDLGVQLQKKYDRVRFGSYRVSSNDTPRDTITGIVNSVILVGGSSKLRLVRERLSAFFERDILHLEEDAQMCVGMGALESIMNFSEYSNGIREVLYVSYELYVKGVCVGSIPRSTTIPFDVCYGIGKVKKGEDVLVEVIEVVNEHREKIIDLFIDASYFCTKFSYSFAVIHVVVKMDGLLSLYYRDDSNGMEILLSTNEI